MNKSVKVDSSVGVIGAGIQGVCTSLFLMMDTLDDLKQKKVF